jgi:predicted nucleic acid-binding protein
MKVLIDTDVLLDVALNRAPHVEASAKLLRWAEKNRTSYIAWHSIANCAYLLKEDHRTFLNLLLSFVTVASVGDREARAALDYPMKDLEDALQAAAALACGATYVITRNLNDYKKSPIKALSPKQFFTLAHPQYAND